MKFFGCCPLKNILNWSREPNFKSIPNYNIEILVRPRNAGSSMDQDFYSDPLSPKTGSEKIIQCCDKFKIIWGAERHHYSTFDVQCSMLDVHF
jgi:hypothetical protein